MIDLSMDRPEKSRRLSSTPNSPSTPVHALAGALFVSVLMLPSLAWACGAFAPRFTLVEHGSVESVERALVHDAETMLYVDLGDGRWTVYQGRSMDIHADVDEIAWLLPVPGVPEVEVAPQMIFERLAMATTPAFELVDESTGDCPAEVRTFLRNDPYLLVDGRVPRGTGAAGAASLTEVELNAAVRAVGSGSAGPYDHVTIETAPGVDDPGARAVEWLQENGYHVDSVDVDLLREYLEAGLNLLAIRLRADAGAEDGGRGLVTDYAMPSDEVAAQIWADEDRWQSLRARSNFAGRERHTLQLLAELFGGEGLLESILRDAVPLPPERVIVEHTTLQRFSARYSADRHLHNDFDDPWNSQPRLVEEDPNAPGPEELLSALESGALVAPCFVEALQRSPQAGGHWSAVLREPQGHRQFYTRLDSTVDVPFQECIVAALRQHLTEAGYASRTFPATISFFFPNPYEYADEEGGFPLLLSRDHRALSQVDWPGVIEEVEQTIVSPIRQLQERLAATNDLTRLFAVVAAEDLTEDVSFAQVPDYDELPALRRATRYIECDGQEEHERNGDIYEVRSWSVEFERGTTVTGRGVGRWPRSPNVAAARLIAHYDQQGEIIAPQELNELNELNDLDDDDPSQWEGESHNHPSENQPTFSRWQWGLGAGIGVIIAIFVFIGLRRS